MKTGDLVKVMRASIGIPRGAIGLIIEKKTGDSSVGYWTVKLVGGNVNGKTRRYLTQDLRRVK